MLESHRSYRRYLVLLVVLSAATVRSSIDAQSPDTLEVRVFHGAPSRIVRLVDEQGRVDMRDGRSLHIVRPSGSSVCMVVVNANPMVFAYDFNAALDPTFLQLTPEAQLALGILGKLGVATASDASQMALPGQLTKLFNAMSVIAADVDLLSKAVAEAAAPGDLDEERGVANNHGLLLAKAGIRAIPITEGRLRNPKLGEYLDRLHVDATKAIETESAALTTEINEKDQQSSELNSTIAKLTKEIPTQTGAVKEANEKALAEATLRKAELGSDKAVAEEKKKALDMWKLTVPILVEHAKKSVTLSQKTVDDYDKASPSHRECSQVRDGRNSFTLKFGANDGVKTTLRSNEHVQLTVDAIFERPLIEVYPASFLVQRDDLRSYTIQDGSLMLSDQDTELQPRLGGMATITLWDRFEELRQVALSVGVGTNVIGGEGAIKDLMLLGTVSYRDSFRVGLGWGRVPIKKLKPGFGVGLPVPDDTTVDELFEEDHKWDFAIMFSVSGAKLGLGN